MKGKVKKMTYKRKYPKITVDHVVGFLVDDGKISDVLMVHQELKGNSIRKSKTSGIQEALDMAIEYDISLMNLSEDDFNDGI